MSDHARAGHRNPLHDYRSRSIYLITIKAARPVTQFAEITLSGVPKSIWTPAGHAIAGAIAEIIRLDSRLHILASAIMPDHVHLVIFVRERIDKHIGYYISRIKGLATSSIRTLTGSQQIQVFEPDYHDRILYGRNQLPTMINYVNDNPRRYAVKCKNPRFFTTVRSLMIGDDRFDACGNLFLLDDFDLQTVRIHRRWCAAELADARYEWRQCALNGGTLVSPFIHPTEKQIMAEAIELGARIIMLTNEPFGERFKPAGRLFDLCAQGRLLLLNPIHLQRPADDSRITRAEALALNEYASRICATRR